MKSRASVEVYKDRSGKWRWRLDALNGRIKAVSAEGYVRRRDCIRAVDRALLLVAGPFWRTDSWRTDSWQRIG